jgi:hypothetical protein
MSEIDISREAVDQLVWLCQTLDMATQWQAVSTGQIVGEMLIVLRAALDRAEADKAAAVEAMREAAIAACMTQRTKFADATKSDWERGNAALCSKRTKRRGGLRCA